MIQYLERKLYKLVRLPPPVPDNTTIVFIHSFSTQGCLQDSLSGSDGGRLADPCSGSTGGGLVCIEFVSKKVHSYFNMWRET